MKKHIAFVLSAVLLLCLFGCAPKQTVDLGSGGAAMEFQGVPWDATPEQAAEKLGIDLAEAESSLSEDSRPEAFSIRLRDYEVFGQTAVSVLLSFFRYQEHSDYFGLSCVEIYYPEDCDTQALEAMFRELYGETVEREDLDNNIYWNSKATFGDLLTEEQLETVKAVYSNREGADLSKLEANFAAMQEEPAVYMAFSSDYTFWERLGGADREPPEGTTKVHVLINGAGLQEFLQYANGHQ